MYCSHIWVGPSDPERIYLGGASVYRSSDGGRSFGPDGASGVHLDHHALWIDPANSNHLILAGDGGVSVSRATASSQSCAPLEGLAGGAMESAAHLFPVRRATSYNRYRPQGWTPGIYAAPNPPDGARIRYHLGSSGDSVTVRITDGAGTVVRKLGGSGDAGLHEIVWDLRIVEEGADGEPLNPGPRVLPGSYTVTLAVGEETMHRTLEVRLDPRVEISPADLRARQEAMLDSYRLSGALMGARGLIRSMNDHLNGIATRIREAAAPPEGLREQVDTRCARSWTERAGT